MNENEMAMAVTPRQRKKLDDLGKLLGRPPSNHAGISKVEADTRIKKMVVDIAKVRPPTNDTIRAWHVARRMGGDNITHAEVLAECVGKTEREVNDLGIKRQQQTQKLVERGKFHVAPASAAQKRWIATAVKLFPKVMDTIGAQDALENVELNAVQASIIMGKSKNVGIDHGFVRQVASQDLARERKEADKARDEAARGQELEH